MPLTIFCRVFAVSFLIGLAAGCSRPTDNPYARIQNAPLVKATLHTVTVASPDAAQAQRLDAAGYTHAPLPSNYPLSVEAEAAIWQVPVSFAATSAMFMAQAGQGPDVRLIVMPDVKPLVPVDAEVLTAFYGNVLGSAVPRWAGSSTLKNGARVQAWTFLVDDVLAARQRFLEAAIPVTFTPVRITTAYLGDHQTLAIQAPDGAVVQLVQGASQKLSE
jgi:hypothetical protein